MTARWLGPAGKGELAALAFLASIVAQLFLFGVGDSLKAGEQSQIELFGQLLNAHASFTEDVVKAGVTVTRELISA